MRRVSMLPCVTESTEGEVELAGTTGAAEAVGVPVLQWEGLSCSYKGEVVVQDVSGELHSHELMAVMGPSGAGKTACHKCHKSSCIGIPLTAVPLTGALGQWHFTVAIEV